MDLTHWNPVFSIVRELVEVETRSGDPEVFVAAAVGPDPELLGMSATSLNGSGAGLAWPQAAGAAIGECLERYAAASIRASDLHFGSAQELRRGGRATHDPTAWSLYDETQDVPYPQFDSDLRIAW